MMMMMNAAPVDLAKVCHMQRQRERQWRIGALTNGAFVFAALVYCANSSQREPGWEKRRRLV